MFLQPASVAAANPPLLSSPQLKPCRKLRNPRTRFFNSSNNFRGNNLGPWRLVACSVESNNKDKPAFSVEILDATKISTRALANKALRDEAQISSQEQLKLPGLPSATPTPTQTQTQTQTPPGRKQGIEQKHATFSFTTSVQDDPFVYKLSTRLGGWHGAPIPPLFLLPQTVISLFGFFFLVGVVFDKVWTSRKTNNKQVAEVQSGIRPQVPTSISQFLEQDLQRKESVEWVNMVLGKLWKVYRVGLENWMVGLLQPVIDNIKKPGYVQRVEIKQFFLGDEPISVRSVERRTSRRANDLQYQIGLRYTGGARMLLMLSLKFGFMPIMIPVGVRDLDVDGELWVKLGLVPSEPWVGTATWAFVSLPKIKLNLAPFRFFNLMAIPVLSMFLTKLFTEDLPRLFVRPKKIVLNFQKGQATGPDSKDFRNGVIQEGNKDFAGELSVTLVDARKLNYVPYGKTDPHVILVLGDQVIQSKKNSQTTVIGPPGAPIWNQDFQLLVVDPQKQKLGVKVRDYFGLTNYTVGMGEVELGTLQDTVPTDRVVPLKGGWGLFRKSFAGEILLRLTYKAYVEDEEDDGTGDMELEDDISDDEMPTSEDSNRAETSTRSNVSDTSENEPFMDKFVALLVSEEFQGIFESEADNMETFEEVKSSQLVDTNPEGGSPTSQLMNDQKEQE
ncbi:hypothetical protein KI387_018317, partial [Taxus chinensis]